MFKEETSPTESKHVGSEKMSRWQRMFGKKSHAHSAASYPALRNHMEKGDGDRSISRIPRFDGESKEETATSPSTLQKWIAEVKERENRNASQACEILSSMIEGLDDAEAGALDVDDENGIAELPSNLLQALGGCREGHLTLDSNNCAKQSKHSKGTKYEGARKLLRAWNSVNEEAIRIRDALVRDPSENASSNLRTSVGRLKSKKKYTNRKTSSSKDAMRSIVSTSRPKKKRSTESKTSNSSPRASGVRESDVLNFGLTVSLPFDAKRDAIVHSSHLNNSPCRGSLRRKHGGKGNGRWTTDWQGRENDVAVERSSSSKASRTKVRPVVTVTNIGANIPMDRPTRHRQNRQNSFVAARKKIVKKKMRNSGVASRLKSVRAVVARRFKVRRRKRLRALFRKWKLAWRETKSRHRTLISDFVMRRHLILLRKCFCTWRGSTDRRDALRAKAEVLYRWRNMLLHFRKWSMFASDMKRQRESDIMQLELQQSRAARVRAVSFRRSRLLSVAFVAWCVAAQTLREERLQREEHKMRRTQMRALLERRKKRRAAALANARRAQPKKRVAEPSKVVVLREKSGTAMRPSASKNSKGDRIVSENAAPKTMPPPMTRANRVRVNKKLSCSVSAKAPSLCSVSTQATKGTAMFNSMKARTAERQRRRDALKVKYAERKAAEAAAKLAVEQAREYKMEEEKKRRRSEKARAERERSLRLQQRQLASMHNKRRLLVWCGWKPWQTLMELRVLRSRKADNFRRYALVRRSFLRWVRLRNRRRKKRLRRELRRRARATEMYFRRVAGRVFAAWRDRCAIRRASRHRAEQSVRVLRMQRHLRCWRRIAACRWRQRKKLREALEQRALEMGEFVQKRHVFEIWKDSLPELHRERTLLARRRSMLRKASRWFEELEIDDSRSLSSKRRSRVVTSGNRRRQWSYRVASEESRRRNRYA